MNQKNLLSRITITVSSYILKPLFLPNRGLVLYLSLQVKGHHGETQVKQEVLPLETLQGPPDTERHHVWPLDEQEGAENVQYAQTHDAHETGLQHEQSRAEEQTGTCIPQRR